MDTSLAITLRPAAHGDRDWVLRINNEPGVRKNSIRRAPILAHDHEAWFSECLADPLTLLLIGMLDRDPVAVLRAQLDRERATATVSIALDPAYRGQGLGRRFIREGTRAVLERGDVEQVLAFTRPENEASQRAFEAAGYRRLGSASLEGIELVEFACGRSDLPPSGARPE